MKYRLEIKSNLMFAITRRVRAYATDLLLLPSKDIYWFPCKCRADHAYNIAKEAGLPIIGFYQLV